ncbi:MAG TPA: beta-ketoacyl-ACP synthase II [Streptosporangiaceae bacterium]
MTAPAARPGFAAAVTGLGLVSPAGIGVAENWARICSGVSTAARDPALAGLSVDFSCRVPGFDADALLGRRRAWRLDRVAQFAVVAAREALADAGLAGTDPEGGARGDTGEVRPEWDDARVGVVLGSGIGGAGTWEEQHRRLLDQGPRQVSALLIPMLAVNMIAGYVAMDCGARGPNFVTSTACASGTTAIGVARELLRSGACDIVLAGGAEACVIPSIVTGFSQMGALSRRADDPAGASRPFDAGRDGFVAAEAAAVLVLERPEHAAARGARVRAYVSGYGASADAHHATAPDPGGRSVERAMRAALLDAGITPEAVAHVNAHGTSTPLNDDIEGKVIHRVLGDAPAVTSTKGVTGHALGAAGAIEAAYTVLAVENSIAPPTANLDSQDPDIPVDVVAKEARNLRIPAAVSNSFGFGGQNAVLVVTAT